MKKILMCIMSTSMLVQTTLPVFADENEVKDEIKNYTINQFLDKNKNLRNEYYELISQEPKVINELNPSTLDNIQEKPEYKVISKSVDDNNTSAILYDEVNNSYAYYSSDENADNFLIGIDGEDYLFTGEDDNIYMTTEDGEKTPVVETYYDPYYEGKDFDWLEDEPIVTASTSWNLQSSNVYTSTSNLTVTIINIAFSVATGVVAAYIGVSTLTSKILGYVGVGWTAAQSFTQSYLTYVTQWKSSACSVYYKARYDYYVIPKSSNESVVKGYKDFYKYQYTLNANPSSPPSGCSGFSSYSQGPYSYH